MSDILHLGEENFINTISSTQDYVLVDFYTPSCRPCRAMIPTLKLMQKTFENKLLVYKVNAEECKKICKENKVDGVPTLIIFKDGEEVDRKTGFLTVSQFKEWIKTSLE
jgi:thioredoxin 1